MEQSVIDVHAKITSLQTRDRKHCDAREALKKEIVEAINLLAFKTASLFVVVTRATEARISQAEINETVIYGVSSEVQTYVAENVSLTLFGGVPRFSYDFDRGGSSFYLKVGCPVDFEIRDADRDVYDVYTVQAYATNAEAEAGKQHR
jgi:hypothetical protein